MLSCYLVADKNLVECKTTFFINKLKIQSNFPLDGRAWAISEVASPQTEEVAAVLPFGSTAPIPPDPAIQVIQHIQRPSEYVVITSQVRL